MKVFCLYRNRYAKGRTCKRLTVGTVTNSHQSRVGIAIECDRSTMASTINPHDRVLEKSNSPKRIALAAITPARAATAAATASVHRAGGSSNLVICAILSADFQKMTGASDR